MNDDFDDFDDFDEFDEDFENDEEFDDSDDFDEDFEDEDFEDEDFEDEDFEDDFDFDFDDDFDNLDSKSKEDLDIFDEKPLETDSGYKRDAVEVHVSQALTSRKIVELMDTYPALKRITCPKSIYDRISPKYIAALDDLNVSIEVKYNWGKSKYTKEEIDSVIDLLNEGKNPNEIASILDIPLKRVNYFKSKYHDKVNVKHHKRKYDDECRQRIISMREEGIKPKDISQKLNIPIRSVYYILNKK